jgi:hypothetical protein
MPGRTRSSVNLAWPVMSRGSSRRLIPEPKMRVAMGSSYFRISAAAAWMEATMFW